MQVFAIPVEGKTIVYRPLRRLAFVGNRAMADLALELAGGGGAEPDAQALAAAGEAGEFLQRIGFFEPDPPPPPLPAAEYRPTMAVLLLTNRCNLRCTYCYASGGEGPAQDLAPPVARAAIDWVHANAVALGQARFELTFHGGGEPLVAWEGVQQATAYARAKELPCRVSMVTNGVCTARQREWLLTHLDSLSLSFDGRPETQDRQRPAASGRGSFKAAARMLRALDEAGFPYGIRMTATAPWRGRLPEDVRWVCEETGCRGMQVEPAFNNRRGAHRGPTPEEGRAFADAFIEAFEIASRAGRQLTYSGARPWLVTRTFCAAPYSALIVNPAGRLVSCYEVTDDGHPLADLSGLGWVSDGEVRVDGAARARLLDTLHAGQARCAGCFCVWHCAGDCYTRSAASTPEGDEEYSARCSVNRAITARMLLGYIAQSDGVWRGQRGDAQTAQLMRTF